MPKVAKMIEILNHKYKFRFNSLILLFVKRFSKHCSLNNNIFFILLKTALVSVANFPSDS